MVGGAADVFPSKEHQSRNAVNSRSPHHPGAAVEGPPALVENPGGQGEPFFTVPFAPDQLRFRPSFPARPGSHPGEARETATLPKIPDLPRGSRGGWEAPPDRRPKLKIRLKAEDLTVKVGRPGWTIVDAKGLLLDDSTITDLNPSERRDP